MISSALIGDFPKSSSSDQSQFLQDLKGSTSTRNVQEFRQGGRAMVWFHRNKEIDCKSVSHLVCFASSYSIQQINGITKPSDSPGLPMSHDSDLFSWHYELPLVLLQAARFYSPCTHVYRPVHLSTTTGVILTSETEHNMFFEKHST